MTSDVHTTPSASKNNNRRVAIISAALVVGLLGSGGLVLRGTEAVFTDNTENAANSWQAGSVTITDNDSNAAMFNVPTMKPGDTVTRCITVNYAGNVAAAVKLYASAGSGNLRPDLNLTINEGSGTAIADCTNFVAGSDIYTGDLAEFTDTDHDEFGEGVSSWTPSGAESKAYRFTVQLDSGTDDSKQGESASATFRWEAQAGS